MSNEFNNGFAVPGMQQKSTSNMDMSNGLPDFDRMSKAELKQFDAQYGSYIRLLKGKPITMLWLLNHYSDANAAAYKAQKQNKGKQAGSMPAMQSVPPQMQPQMQAQVQPQMQQQVPPQMQPQVQSQMQQQVAPQIQQPVPSQNSAQFNSYSQETPGPAPIGATVYIDRNRMEQRRPRAYLECVGFEQTVEINELPYVIGRNPACVSLCIEDNITVSGKHAEITYQNGNYMIKDLASVNHVLLNDVEIDPNSPVVLKNGTEILLGDEKFIFFISE